MSTEVKFSASPLSGQPPVRFQVKLISNTKTILDASGNGHWIEYIFAFLLSCMHFKRLNIQFDVHIKQHNSSFSFLPVLFFFAIRPQPSECFAAFCVGPGGIQVFPVRFGEVPSRSLERLGAGLFGLGFALNYAGGKWEVGIWKWEIWYCARK
jgi:hypothetical protein